MSAGSLHVCQYTVRLNGAHSIPTNYPDFQNRDFNFNILHSPTRLASLLQHPSYPITFLSFMITTPLYVPAVGRPFEVFFVWGSGSRVTIWLANPKMTRCYLRLVRSNLTQSGEHMTFNYRSESQMENTQSDTQLRGYTAFATCFRAR
jgi:hypothetical protein